MTTVPVIRDNKLWSKTYIIMLVVSLLVGTGHYILMGTLPLYAANLSGKASAAGLMVTLLTLSALLFRPVFGNLMDKRGRKVVLVTGAAILMAVAVLYNLTSVILLIFINRFINGIGFSAHTTASGTIVADVVPPDRLSEGIGYYGISNTLAMAVGPAIGLFLIESRGYSILFITVLVLSVLSLISTLLVNYEKEGMTSNAAPARTGKGARSEASTDESEPARCTESPVLKLNPKKEPFLEKSAVLPSLVMFFVALSFGAIITFIPSFGLSRNIDNIGVFFTAYALAVLAARAFTGRLADRHGFFGVLLPGFFCIFLSLILLAFAYSLPAVLTSAVFYGLGYGTVYPLINAIIIKLCPPSRRGSANATIFAAMDIGIGSGAFVWGFISQGAGFAAVYLLSALFILVALAVYLVKVHPVLKAVKSG